MAVSNVIANSNYKSVVGVVVNAGERLRTIRIRVANQAWNDRIQKHYASPYHLLVNDPRRSCEVGDIIRVRSNWRVSKHVRHVVSEIISPFGTPLDQRPPVLTELERVTERAAKRKAKDERQAGRGRVAAIERLKDQVKFQQDLRAAEETARKHLDSGPQFLQTIVDRLILKENDLNKIASRIVDTIKIQHPQYLEWVSKDPILTCLTFWVTLGHAAAKQTYTGVTLPEKAGRDPQSSMIIENRTLAKMMQKQRHDFGEVLLPYLAKHQTKAERNDIKTALGLLQSRLTKNWTETVFDHYKADPAATRIETIHKLPRKSVFENDEPMNWKSSLAKHHETLQMLQKRQVEIQSKESSADKVVDLDDIAEKMKSIKLKEDVRAV